MKKVLMIIIPLVFLVAGGVFLFLRKDQKTTPSNGTTDTSTQVETVIEDNSFVTLVPRQDGHKFKLEVKNLTKTEVAEYELSYMAGDFSRGAIGEVKVSGNNSFSRDLLLGSESCTGDGETRSCRYRYDEGVTGGVLTLRFRNSSGRQKVTTDFHLQKGSGAKGKLTSSDGVFEFQGSLAAGSYYVIYGTIGQPKLATGKVLSGPYGVSTAGSSSAKGTVKIRLIEPNTQAKILGWGGSEWQEYTKGLKNDGQFVSANVDSLTIFMVVAP